MAEGLGNPIRIETTCISNTGFKKNHNCTLSVTKARKTRDVHKIHTNFHHNVTFICRFRTIKCVSTCK